MVSVHGSNSGFGISFAQPVEQIAEAMRDVDRWAIPYITASTLTDVAKGAAMAERKALPWRFDRPTPYVSKGLLYRPADKNWLVSEVYVSDEHFKGNPVHHILRPHVQGGPRRAKRYEVRLRNAGILGPNEFTVPGAAAPLDPYGNLRGGHIERMLSQLQAAEQYAGYMANETGRSRRRNRGRVNDRYFVAKGDTSLPRGIWLRNGRRVRPFLIFVQGAPSYSPIYPFGQVAADYAEDNFRRLFTQRFNSFVAKGKILKGAGFSSLGTGYLDTA